MDDAVNPITDATTTASGGPAQESEADLTGQVLGEFRILHRIGRGGMGQVYLAEQVSLKRKVALKLLNRDTASNERSLQRFKAEAENVARATHANIVQIYTIGKTDGINYIALEYVDGKNLREFVEKKGTPELSLGLHIMAQVAAALQRASELGVIHRDIKPENIMLTKKGEVKVADFGLSRCFEESNQQNLTQSQVVMGTPLYMSPEQVERRTVDSRTDIYSFGVTCYYMFAGHPPFRGQSPIDVAYQHVHQEPHPLAEIRPDLPADLPRIVHKMMAKKPEERYQTAREVMRDINALRESLNLGAIAAVSISSSFLGSGPDALNNSATRTWPDGKATSSTARAAFAGSLLLALAGSLLFGWYQQRESAARDRANDVNFPVDDPGQVRGLLTTQEREKELKSLVQKYAQPENQLELNTALNVTVELSLFYLKEKKLDEADRFFTEISNSQRPIAGCGFLGKLGHAMVLAFKDEYVESNKKFVEIAAEIERKEGRFPPKKKDAGLKKEEMEAFKLLWKDDWKLREMVARALNYNYANKPDEFPAQKLDAYRFPPKPQLKSAPPPP